MTLHLMQNTQTDSESILIVDDVASSLDVMMTYLKLQGYQVHVAHSGPEALEQVEDIKPNLILLDVMMPEMTGYEVLAKLREIPCVKDTPVIFMSALTETRDVVKGFDLGAVDYVAKPLHQDEVMARVKTHLTINRQKRLIVEQSALKDRFMQIAGHDLRNPAAAIATICTLQREEKGSPYASHDEAYRDIEILSETMLKLIQDFMDVQKLSSGSIRFSKGETNLASLTNEVLSQFQSLAVKKSIRVETSFPEELPVIRADAARTHQAIANYVSNALKYSPIGEEIRISIFPQGDQYRMEVQDFGAGVPEQERKKLFQEFAKLSPIPTGGETSTGLGLSIVKRMIEAQGGTVGATFPETGGSIFWLELPKADPQEL